MRSLSKVNSACAVTGQEHGGQVCTRHLHTPFAYAINKTPYVILYWFSVKITLFMYILCGITKQYYFWVFVCFTVYFNVCFLLLDEYRV